MTFRAALHAKSRIVLILLALVATGLPLVAGVRAAHAGMTLSNVSPAAGWATPGYAANYSKIGEQFSSAAVGDIDGDGNPDFVAGYPDGYVNAWHTDGTLFLRYFVGPGAVQASPTLVDLNRDGVLDVVSADTDGDVVAFTGRGQQLFRQRAGSNGQGVFGTPAVADLNRDGRLDIVVSSWDTHIYAWHADDGSMLGGFPIPVQDTIWSSPAIADLDRDGYPEIIVGWDCDGAPGQACAGHPGGYVGAFRHDGSRQYGWPQYIPGQVVWSTPAIGDVNGDGSLDVVVGTGNMPASMCCGSAMRQTKVFGFRADGTTLPGWPVEVGANVTSSPALGDLDGDGLPDVAVVDETGQVDAIKGNTGGMLWRHCIANDPNFSSAGCPKPLHSSVSIADIFGTGHQQVLTGGEQWIHVFDGRNGALLANAGTYTNTVPVTATPTVASVNGKAWIVVATGDAATPRGKLFVYTSGVALGQADWPTFKGSSARRSVLGDGAPLTGPGVDAIAAKYTALGGSGSALGAPLGGGAYTVPGGVAQSYVGGAIYWSQATGAWSVRGAILSRYQALGGAGGPLGFPTTDELGTPDKVGRFNHFTGNGVGASIYWTPQTGAWSVRGAIRNHWAQLGWEAGALGYPTTDELGTPDGVGRFNHFTGNGAGASVYWSPGTGAWAVKGAIRVHWAQLGWENGPLGYPTTDEGVTPDGHGRFNHFSGKGFGASVYWSPQTGAWSVTGAIRNTWASLGWETSRLGYPTSDEYGIPGGRRNNFAGGTISWTPGGGTTLP
ncbi:MAG TPA: FG-GAP-like repeat-containing protein [Frankiaceae bacterium]